MHRSKDKSGRAEDKKKLHEEVELFEETLAAANEGDETAVEEATAATEEVETGTVERLPSAEDLSELQSEIDALKADLAEANSAKLRLAAEYDNFRKRSRQEKDDLYAKSVMDVCALWLPVLDNLDRALKTMQGIEHEASKLAADGVVLVYRQAEEALSKLNVKEIPALGASFDPNLHEAVLHVEDAEKGNAEIIEVFLKGYILGDKVLRHSVVKVAN